MKTLPVNQKGFTLVELLVVIGILGILMVGALVAINPVARFNAAKDATAKGAVDQASASVQAYYANVGSWPASWNALVTSGDLQAIPKGPDGQNLIFTVSANGVGIGFESATSGAVGYFCWKSNGVNGHLGSDACTAP